MDEKYFKDKISGYFDGDLKPDEMEMMREWLETSEEGQKALAELGRLDEFVEQHSQLSGGEDFWEAQAQKIEARLGFETNQPENVTTIAKPKSSGMTWKLLAAAASIVLLAYIGINEFDVLGPDDVVPPPMKQLEQPVVAGEDKAGEGTSAADESALEVTPEGNDRERANEVREESLEKSVGQNEVDIEAAKPSPVKEQAPAPTRQTPPAPTRQTPPAATADQPNDDKLAAEQPAAQSPTPEPVTPSSALPTLSGELRDKAARTARRAEPASLDLDAVVLAEVAPTAAEVDSMLPVWRATYAQSDSMLASFKSETKKKPSLDIPEGVQGYTSQSGRSSQPASQSEREQVERRLLEACYNVARLTPDSTEQRLMRARLEQYAGDDQSPHKALARDYLSRLAAPK